MLHHYPFNISQVVAAAHHNRAIGLNGQLLWHLPEDLRFFKNLTWGMPVIMGRKTYSSINKPLPGRTNIILTRNDFSDNNKVIVAHSIEEALNYSETLEAREVYIIGGSEVYAQFMPYTNTIYYTRVYANIEKADTFYPEIIDDEWLLKSSLRKEADENNQYAMQFETWERKLPKHT